MTSVNWVTLLDPSVYFGIPAVGFRLFDGRYLENTQMEPDVVVPLDPTRSCRASTRRSRRPSRSSALRRSNPPHFTNRIYISVAPASRVMQGLRA